MSKAKYPNRDALDKALHVYLEAMYSFVSECLGEELLREALRLPSDSNIEEKIEVKDIARLIGPRTRWENYFSEKFKVIDRDDIRYYDARSVTGLIVEGRNQVSHQRLRELDRDFTRCQLFLIVEILGKINNLDAQREVEDIRDKLFDDTAAQLEVVSKAVAAEKAKYEKSIAEIKERLAAAEKKNDELLKQKTGNAAKLKKKEEDLEKLSEQLVSIKLSEKENKKQFNSISKQLKKVQAVHSTCEKRLTATEAERDDYKEALETASKELKEAETEWQACEDSLAAMQNLFEIATIGNREVQMVFPSFDTDFAVRVLDRRGTDKRNYLLDLLDQKQPTIIYVQSEEKIDQLLNRVLPEKADVVKKRNAQTSAAEESEILEKLENGELIAVVSNTAFSTLASPHCIEHFVFCHLVPGVDEFYKRCEPAFASGKNTYLHLIYNSEQDIEGLAKKYPDRKTLEKLYSELRKLAETSGEFIKQEDVYSKLGMAKLGVETGLAIFEELQLLERNDEGIKLLPPTGKKLDESRIYCRGEELKKGTEDFRDFQFGQPVKQIWEGIEEKLDMDSKQILCEVNANEVYASVSEIESDLQLTEMVENDSGVDEGDTEAGQAPKPERANAQVTEEQVTEIRSRSAAGEANSELAEEDSEKKPEVKQSEFWQPIRTGEFGALFAGKPVPIGSEGWITKTIRNIGVCLYLTNQRCYVQIYFHGANGSERREKIMTLFPKSEYVYAYRDSPRETKVQFPVLDKGRKDQEDWDEIREKLVAMGTDIYNKIDESDL